MEIQVIQNKIYEIRGRRVMIDFDLAEMYGVTTGNLNKAVKRNIERFPDRFMFQLTNDEFLRFQNGISNRGGTRYMPFAFTEQGVSMLSAVLRSPIAVQVSISIMDAFVALRQMLTNSMEIRQLALENAEIRAKLALLEHYDEETMEAVNDLSEDMRKDIDNLYNAIGELSVKPPHLAKPCRPIGFKVGKDAME